MSRALVNNLAYELKPLTNRATWRLWFVNNAPWKTWLLALFAWVLLLYLAQSNLHEHATMGAMTHVHGDNTIWSNLRNGVGHWALMIVAMMFPILNEPINHLSFSVARRRRNQVTIAFLLAYQFVWLTVGVAYLMIVGFVGSLNFAMAINQELATALVFFAAGLFELTAFRGRIKVSCSYSIPISLTGWKQLSDSLRYGIRYGLLCVRSCWLIMIPMAFEGHHLLTMLLITLLLIYERYGLRHTSRIPTYLLFSLGAVFTLLGIF